MIDRFLTRISNAHSFLAKVWVLVRPYWFTQERSTMRSVVALDDSMLPDLWTLKRRFPQWLPWIDADYGSAAYLPLVDGGNYVVTLAAAGGLIARPADDATARRIAETGVP